MRDGTLPTGAEDDGLSDIGGSMSVGMSMSMSLGMLSAGSLSATSGSVIKQGPGSQRKVRVGPLLTAV